MTAETLPAPDGLVHLGGRVYAHPELVPLLRPADSVSVHPDNPRRGDVDVIAESIAVNGLFRPLVAQRSTGYVLGGNHTLAALQTLGATQVPVTFVDVDDRQAHRIILADNRTSDLGGYDVTSLVEVIDSLGEDAFAGTGYSEADLDQLLVDLQSAAEVTLNASGYYEAIEHSGGQRTDPEAEWEGMPSYERGDITAHRQILVSFKNEEDLAEFVRRLDFRITPKTRYLWFPQQEWEVTKEFRVIAGEGSS